MPRKTSAKKDETTFGEDPIEEMRLVLAHWREKVELEQVWPKFAGKAIRKRMKKSDA